jgi:hypothetical protein
MNNVKAVVLSSILAGIAVAADNKPATTPPGQANKPATTPPPQANAPAATTPSTATPSTTTTAATAEMTCGQMMARKAELPTKLSELITTVADNVEAHAKWMSASKDKAAKKEHDALMKVAKDHRQLAKQLTTTATTMTAQKDLPGTPHDPKTMDVAKMTELTTKQIKLSREMATLLNKDADEAEKMLTQMKSAQPGTAGGK